MKTIKSLLHFSFIVGLVYLVLSYNDTPEFQSIMAMFFGSEGYFLSHDWLEKRVLILSFILFLSIISYYSIWLSYVDLIQIYSQNASSAHKPPVNPLLACYIYSHHADKLLATWLIKYVLSGSLYLHYCKGVNAWSVSKNPAKLAANDFDQTLLDIMFQQTQQKIIKDKGREPDPQFSEIAKRLHKKIETDNRSLLKTKPSSIPVWIFVIIFLAELTSLNYFYPEQPGLVALGLLSALATGFFIYVLINQLAAFFNRNKLIAWLITGVAMLVAGIIFWGASGIYESFPWFSSFIYLQLITAMAVAITFLPPVPKDQQLLMQIIAYQKYLQQQSSMFQEEDLPWLIALDAAPTYSKVQLQFMQHDLPVWLKSQDTELNIIRQEIFISYPQSVNHAVNGRSKSRSGSGRRSGLSGREI
jgi:hypothetical protein